MRDAPARGGPGRHWPAGPRPGPSRRLIATLPALEVPRPDWPAEAVVVGPLHFEPTNHVLAIPPGSGPVVVVAPSTALTGARGMAQVALDCLVPGRGCRRVRGSWCRGSTVPI
ncbi:putative glycosyltransferase [Mycobacterium xenopi 4042]|uniref:Putative glycosyltransferase n=1 Tax=Mycobacterium xenopi 4042 TaxID=1299334 RepID=X8CH18_MYCXE|nr:putative glycosyltransferase [Mycobacterium xenopi 4042]